MKVLLVADGDTKYGAQHSLCQMAIALKRNYDIELTVIVTEYSKLTDEMQKDGIEICCVNYTPFYQNVPNDIWKLPIKYVIRWIEYYYGKCTALKKIEKKININCYDLVHSNSSREDFGACIAQKYNLPLLWHIREFGDRDYKCYSYRKNYINYMNKRADMFIAVSDAVKNHWINKGINEDKIVRVYNGVKINDNNLKNNNRFNNECIKLVITGSISKTKGQVHAIEVVKRVKDKGYKVKLDIIGDGPTSYVKYLKKIVNLNKLNDIVSFLGYKDNVENCLNEYDVGLICSKDEAFGRVTAEYMMAGLPILASNTGANTELIRDGIDGLLYTYGDDDDMEKKLISIIKAGNRMGGENTHEYAMREFSDVVNAGHIYEVYNDVLRKYEG